MTVRVLRDLMPDEARAFLQHAFMKSVVQVVGRCAIRYEGRAQSVLPAGDRLVLLKPDGTLLVHTNEKLKPVNWQPPGCTFSAAVEDGDLVVSVHRVKPRELVRIRFERLDAVASLHLDDGAGFALEGSEDDLQAALAKVPEVIEPGFVFQKRERDSRRGPMDLYGVDAHGARVVVEVKRRAATVADVEQLRRYVEKEREARAGSVRGILVAPKVSGAARKYLEDLVLEWREVDVAKVLAMAATARGAGQAPLTLFGGSGGSYPPAGGLGGARDQA